MIDLHTYLLFIGAAFVLVIAPGPDMAYMLARTVAQGRAAGFLAAAGINAGAYVHVCASVVGLTAVLAASSFAFTVIKWAGAGYLVWMGYRALTSKGEALKVEGAPTQKLRRRSIFWQGFWSDVLNPKVAIFFLAFLPQFVSVDDSNPLVRMLLLSAAFMLMTFVVFVGYGLFAASIRDHVISRPRVLTWMRRTFAAAFVALGARLAFADG